jgi:hypothetical protein
MARNSAGWFERLDRFTDESPTRFAYFLRTRANGDSAAPAGVPWLLHQATQLSAGRVARGWVSSVRRTKRARDRHERMRAERVGWTPIETTS